MKNYIFGLILILTLGSCSRDFYCSKCPTKDSTYVKIKDSLSIHVDTTWRIFHNPGDSLKLADNLYAYKDSLGKCRIADASGTTESGKIKVKYIIRNDSIFIQCDTKPYDIKIAELTTTIEKFHEMYTSYTKTATVTTKRPRTWWTWLSYWQSWVCLIFIGIIIFRFILKKLKLKIGFTTSPPFIKISSI